MKVSIFQRLFTTYMTLGTVFGVWLSPIITGMLILILRVVVTLCRIADHIFFPRAFKEPLKNPILIVGNPRSGTTFLHRYLVKHGIGTGSQLWQLLYPSIILQKLIKPFLPLLEKVSPTRYHSTSAHKTSLQSIETDDVAILFRYMDGFFLYGFILSWAKENFLHWIDPLERDTSDRDYTWMESIWLRNQYVAGSNRSIGKLFSLSINLPYFLEKYPDCKILYIVRDPMAVIPSALSLVTGVLDKRFGFWNLSAEKRQHFISRLYNGLIMLLLRFHDDWSNDRIDKSRVFIVRFDRIMTDFDHLMDEVLEFIDHVPSNDLMKEIVKTSEKQRLFQSSHAYDLEKFGLNAEQIKSDCAPIYETFLQTGPDL